MVEIPQIRVDLNWDGSEVVITDSSPNKFELLPTRVHIPFHYIPELVLRLQKLLDDHEAWVKLDK